MASVEAVSFLNAAGLRLFGTLHKPDVSRPNVPAVVLLSPGVKMRVGPGRLYVPLTALLTSQGFTVLRFDFFGLGDSEGELAETMLADVYNHIEVGRYVDDTLAATKWLRETHGFKRFMLGGLCGGAITAVLAAERDPSVESLLSIGMTVTLASNAAAPAKYLTRAQLDEARRAYYGRLLKPESWLRLLTLQSDYGRIWHSIRRLFVADKPTPVVAAATATPDQRGNANPLFPTAFLAFLARGGRAFMLFSEKDRLPSEYREKFAEPYAEQLRPYLPRITEHEIPSANHVLSLPEWQQEMTRKTGEWLQSIHAA